MHKPCASAWCKSAFEVSAGDLGLLEKLSPTIGGRKIPIPPPALCPDCRQQRRIVWRNERSLYHRPCGLCGKTIVSVYSADSGLTVYCPECFWQDGWDPRSSGREMDFSRPFFPQLKEVMMSTPFLSNVVVNCVNSDFNSFCVDTKDAYMSARVADSEHIYFCYLPLFSLYCIDSYGVDHCQYCYECIDCWSCYESFFSQLCRNCTNVQLCYCCTGCKNCVGCVNLRNASNCFFNEQLSPDEYGKRLAELRLSTIGGLERAKERFDDLRRRHPVRAVFMLQSENALGDYISNSRDVSRSFDVDQSESVSYSWGVEYSRDIGDADFIYYGERCYENISNSRSTDIYFSFAAFQGTHDVFYCLLPFNGTRDCFGCAGLKHAEYCILNKQYSKEEYERLAPKIITHMRSTGEWGEFFPMELSPFAYNETVAHEYFPLREEEAAARGWKWKDQYDEMQKVTKVIPASQLPDSLDDIPDDILNWAIECAATKRPFKIIKQELDFYRRMGLPVPHFHPDERFRRRTALRNPRKLWKRNCANCQKPIATSYSPERPERVYCEECYLKEVY